MPHLRRPLIALAAVVALAAASCSSSTKATTDTSAPAAAQASSTTSTSAATTTTVKAAAPDAAGIAAVVCTSAPTRMSGAAETYTAESWKCTGANGDVRIDIYDSADQKAEALAVTMDYYRQTGDSRTAAELPFVCGDSFSIGMDTNAGRDAAIAALTGAGITASTCTG